MKMTWLINTGHNKDKSIPAFFIRSFRGAGEYYVHGGTNDIVVTEITNNEKEGFRMVLHRLIEQSR
ncbi:hypothetical protein ELQ35_01495 [Peribacillus cavernae]|uniref:Uncharacterized protein n=1 Tax=Peribacillus cavernae TaxID=1674310 RepID=A0A3S0UJ55_9BACI|nr:hypothetical protein [Peribacillus cavernae]MDQ0218051.1 hypothetical protein [Peribacillus cavernae]RUQ32788.1 hypothetical protein ELQ35_01495 [Peribacillus cavernae]